MKGPFSLSNVSALMHGRIPGQVIIQYTDRCNARCPQCDMRVQNRFERSTIELDVAKRVIDSAAEKGVNAVSFTGGEPLMYQDDILALIRHAGQSGIRYIRTGTNGFVFLGSDKPSFERKVHSLAQALAETEIYTFWISVDSVDPEVHEQMRGLPGVLAGIEKALPIFHQYGIYPSANLGINRNAGGDYQTLMPYEPDPERFDADEFYDFYRDAFARFYQRAVDLGFTIINMCYPMSVDPDQDDQLAIYSATSVDRIVRFRPDEKLPLFQALYDTVPQFRSKIRIFTPLTSVLALVKQYSGGPDDSYGCRGGIDFFYVSSVDGNTYPCGYRGNENLGKFWELDLLDRDPGQRCTRCDWECFRDPSELIGPMIDMFARPHKIMKRLLTDRRYARLWLQDVRYYRACNYFNGRTPPDYKKLARFGPSDTSIREGAGSNRPLHLELDEDENVAAAEKQRADMAATEV